MSVSLPRASASRADVPDLARQLSRPLVDPGGDAARRMKHSRVLLVGLGGLGAPASLGLAAAGVGAIVCADFDRVDVSNLQRQVIFGSEDVGQWKVDAAARRLRAIAPGIDVEVVREAFSVDNAARLVAGVDLVIDGADNFATRYLVNDACVLGKRPNVFGSVSRFEGQLAVFAVPGGPCYRCLHPEPPPDGLIPNCAEGGVLGVLPGVIGALQAAEAMKLLTGFGAPLVGRLLLYDALRMRARDITLPRDPECPVCGDSPTITTLQSEGAVCGVVAGDHEVSADVLDRWRQSGVPHVLIDVRESAEHAESHIDGARLVPLSRVPVEAPTLSRAVPVVVYCRTGMRSGRAAAQLRSLGVDARSLAGGIDAWHAIVS